MAITMQQYYSLIENAAVQVTRSHANWTSFLRTASQLYPYRFPDQLAIYAQRPDATACTSYDKWNQRFHRYVKRGSKGIALLDDRQAYPRLRYVFDIADTDGQQQRPEPWRVQDEHHLALNRALHAQYALDANESLPLTLEKIATQQAQVYWKDFRYDILGIVDGSLLEEYDEDNIEAAFCDAARTSLTYVLMNRCGLAPDRYMDSEEFRSVFQFDSPDAVTALGTAVSRISRDVLKSIEDHIQTMEREMPAERTQENAGNNLHPGGRLPDPAAGPAGNAGEAAVEVREDAPDLFEGTQGSPVQPDADVRRTVPAPGGDRRSSAEQAGNPDARGREAAGTDGRDEGKRPAALGGADEQPESAGGGSDPERAGVQLTRDEQGPEQSIQQRETFQLSLFPTEDEQIAFIAETESDVPSVFSMSIPQEDIDHILRMDGNTDHARMKIVTGFSKGKSAEAMAVFLQSTFHGGTLLHNERYAVWYAEDGLHIAKGDAARYLTSARIMSWQEAAAQIGQLLEQGKYAANIELTEAPGHERLELAQSLWYLCHDLSAEARAQDQLSCLSDIQGNGYPEETAHLAERLTDPAFRGTLSNELAQLSSAYGQDKSLLRFHHHKPDNIRQGLQELSLPRKTYASEMTTVPDVGRFITEDEIAASLTRGSGVEGGKGRIYTYFREQHTPKEQADFLKKEYGIGGRSHAVSAASHSYEDHSGKGISLKKRDCPEVQMSWLHVARRISELIRKDRFLTPEEKARYERLRQPENAGSETVAEAERVSYPAETEAVYPAEENQLPYEVIIQTIRTHASEPSAQNFRITDDDLGVGGEKAKFRMNMDAIRLLKELELGGRQATPEQQEVLSRYVGWGGLANAFDESKDNWKTEFAELRAALTPEEYAAARASTLNAHYTSPTVIRAIYDALENMGFQTGNVLEPAMGTGNFFGMLPESMKSSRLYGVELDSITGRIAKQLYPKADVTIAGFETTDRRDFFDLAIGNVPFGNYRVADRAYDKLGFNIHDYFFAKALDQVRPGGVIAFITSHFTLDKQSPEVRKYIARRADLLGAVRLPNNAFKANAGTEVTSDILFIQKREEPLDVEPDWVHLGQTEDGIPINSYFLDNPHMVLGRIQMIHGLYGMEPACVPSPEESLEKLLKNAIRSIQGQYTLPQQPNVGDSPLLDETIPADPNVRNYSYAVVDGNVYYRENSRMVKPEVSEGTAGRIKGMVALRNCVHKLIGQQMDGFISDESIRQTQADLNTLHDSFIKRYGLINSRGNAQAFSDDSSYYLLCSLEILDEEHNLARKADMFFKRTIKPHTVVTEVSTASEALALSVAERAQVDMAYMTSLTGKTEDEIVSDLRGVIFRLPGENENTPAVYQTADEYLSGNVRTKLRAAQQAAAANERYLPNVEALVNVQPQDLDASEIEVRLGATWIGKDHVQQFMEETLEVPFYLRRAIRVNFSPFTAEWNITGKNHCSHNDVNAYVTYGTQRANAYRLLEETLNLRDIRIYDTVTDPDGRETRVLNSKETTLAQQKQQAIKDAFQDWIWRDAGRRQTLVAQYNETFNANRPREYDGRHIVFSGINPEITLREHQLHAIAHILYGGNTLLAHEVGAGKTYEMVAAAMESKRLGLCQKSLFAVPNHLTEQWASEFLRLYPSANILVAARKDFETRNRKKFCARIATGDYDAVIIGHSQFERIPVSLERQERLFEEQIHEIEQGIAELKEGRAERFTIKQMEKTKKGLEARLKKLQDTVRKDDVITFEQLGVDRLFVDEAHSFKNLFLYTKMRNVAGLSTSDAQKSSDMLLKCRYIDEITDSKGVVFATGTPVSNSMTELYTMMRYLQHDLIRNKGLAHFDCWASTFGETTTAIELAPEGTGYRARTRFARFFNLPELMSLFKEAADITTADQLNLPVPRAVYHNVVAQPTDIQKDMVQQLSERAAVVHAGGIEPTKDNMLKITSDGRKLGLDQRLINPNLPDEPQSKLNLCVDNIVRIYQEGNADRLTQLVFCDISTPKGRKAANDLSAQAAGAINGTEIHALERLLEQENEALPDTFTVYDDIRGKLTAHGIPQDQIAFIHDANTELRKKELFAKVRAGQVRILMGSTFKMGAGMNVQDRLIALHDLDAPWRPGDLEQRSGRIIRQGNRNKEVHIYRYVTEATFDAYLWQTLENKQKFISQIMTSKSPVRACEDIDETALSYAEIKALCAGDERIKEKMDLDMAVAKLKLLKANHQSQQFRLEDSISKHFPEQIRLTEERIRAFEQDIQTVQTHPLPQEGFVGMQIGQVMLADKEQAGNAILSACKAIHGLDPMQIGAYRGLDMYLTLEDFGRTFRLTLKGAIGHPVELGTDARGNLTRIDNAISQMPQQLQNQKTMLQTLYTQAAAAREQMGKPFPQEEELRVKSARLAELNTLLNMENRRDAAPAADEPTEKPGRSSVLQRLSTPCPAARTVAKAVPYWEAR